MKQKLKYLGELIKEDNKKMIGNTLIVSPTGSGKTYFIMNDLCNNKKNVLYLCDTTNLKDSVCKHESTIAYKDDYEKIYHDKGIILVMTYSKFGNKVKFDNNDFISNFDLIVCDEAHNLIDYQQFDNSKDRNIERAIEVLIGEYDHTQIVMFTATPKYLEIMTYKYPNFSKNINTKIDYDKDKRIKKYFNKRKTYISHYSDIEKQLIEYTGYFQMGNKCLIYTQNIKVMKIIEDMCNKLELKPISIWSLNSDYEKMDDEQLRVRQTIIDNGILIDDYNVLIINRSMETGVNIYDKGMQLMICDTTNEVQQIQARGRIRNDIDLLVLKTKDDEVKIDFAIDDLKLGEWYMKSTIEEFVIAKNNMRNVNGKLIGMRALTSEMEKYGYKIETKRTRVNKKQITIYKITKK